MLIWRRELHSGRKQVIDRKSDFVRNALLPLHLSSTRRSEPQETRSTGRWRFHPHLPSTSIPIPTHCPDLRLFSRPNPPSLRLSGTSVVWRRLPMSLILPSTLPREDGPMITLKLRTKRSGPSSSSDLPCERRSASWQLRSGSQFRWSPRYSSLWTSRKRFEIARDSNHSEWLSLGRRGRTFLRIPPQRFHSRHRNSRARKSPVYPTSHANIGPENPQQVKDLVWVDGHLCRWSSPWR